MGKRRNIGIIAHIDAGKTTVSERFLYYSGREHRMGEVHEGTARMDWQEEEQQRGITITSAATTFDWAGARVTLIDTPGHVDFTAEVERSLRVLDGAIGVFCGVAGVEAQSETVWMQADRYRVPRIAFVNKLDRVGADFFDVYDSIGSRLKCITLPLMVPIGSEAGFRGVIDLVDMKELTFDEEVLGARVLSSPIDGSRRELAELWRGELLERVADGSDEVMELFLEGKEVPACLLRSAIREGTLSQGWVPVLCGAAFRNKGVQPLLDAVVHYLPAPEDVEAVVGQDPRTGADLRRSPHDGEPMAALVFKLQIDPHSELSYLRLYSGTIERGGTCTNPRTGKRERLGNLYRMHSNQRGTIETARAGDIIAVTGLRFSGTGDTLCDPKHPVLLERPRFPETVISMAVEPRTATERDRLHDHLVRLTREDPTFHFETNQETGQFIMAGMGELHLEVMRNRLIRDFNINANVGKPRVSYRQSLRAAARRRVRFERLLGGKEHFGEIDLEVIPIPEIGGVELLWEDAGNLPPPWRPRIEESVQASISSGGELGFPFVQIRALIRVPPISPQSTEVGLAMAAREAFDEVERSAGAVLLEPVMRFQIHTPEEYFGAINQDLVRYRASIEGVSTIHGHRQLTGTVPLAEVFGYTTTLRSISQGRASMSLEPIGFAPAPEKVAEQFRF
ncbi:MAG: elongation factor G [Planctomycetota bacterium]